MRRCEHPGTCHRNTVVDPPFRKAQVDEKAAAEEKAAADLDMRIAAQNADMARTQVNTVMWIALIVAVWFLVICAITTLVALKNGTKVSYKGFRGQPLQTIGVYTLSLIGAYLLYKVLTPLVKFFIYHGISKARNKRHAKKLMAQIEQGLTHEEIA